MRAVGLIVLAVTLSITVVGGGLLHAVVPHSHGDDHNPSHESAQWVDLHQAIAHDTKKILLAIVSVAIILLAIVVQRNMHIALYMREISPLAKTRDPGAGELLRRGVHRYRVFV